MSVPRSDQSPSYGQGLVLPFDFFRTAATKIAVESHCFTLTLPANGALPDTTIAKAPPESLVTTAFAIQVSRYNGQASIPLRASRVNAGGRAYWTCPLHLETNPETTGQDILTELGDLFARPHSRLSGGQDGGRAAISWLEDQSLLDDAEALERITRAPLAGMVADLHLMIAAGDRGQRAAFVYNASLFNAASIERFAGHLSMLLTSIVRHVDQPISRLSLLTSQELQWLDEVSRGPLNPSAPAFAHQSFELRTAAAPAACAAKFRDESLTYDELNRLANQLAHWLMGRGIGRECHVAVCVEPAFDILIALLGVLKAGAVYVPVDPTYPPARIRAILEDTAPKLVISRANLIERHSLGDYPLLDLDASEQTFRHLSARNPDTVINASQTACIYYTSGTTGRPKGVMASQANLAAYVEVAHKRYSFSQTDVLPAIARFSFSISMFELMLPLASGGTVLILERQHILDLSRMVRTLTEVTFFHAGPSLLRNLLAHIRKHYGDFKAFAGVRHTSSGGDMIAPELLEALHEIFANAEVFVIYGCSEISCMGCTHPVPRGRPVERTYVGHPFDNMIVRVLDGALLPVPVGVIGEILFAGAGVTKGYLGRPDQTAGKFVTIDGLRFYRTGDLGRLSATGALEVLGRNDFQIKLRGMRIEPSEVEHHLRRAPAVRDVVVVAKPASDGELALVAYVVLEGAPEDAEPGNSRSRIAAIRRHMTDHLPDYMVPATYVQLAGLPLNHNMKVDRSALPEPPRVDQRSAEDSANREPETRTEKHVATLWRELLRVAHVGLDDNFFELGGDSLCAVELVLRIEQEIDATVDGMDVLRESLEVLARICDQGLDRPTQGGAGSRLRAAIAGSVATFHFGPANSLYGALHTPEQVTEALAVLVCAPFGRERVRTHFVLRRLARELAKQGVPVMHFDYYGCGDSLGDSADATCDRWQHDVADAYRELERRTGAARIAALGVRFGATLLEGAWRRHGLDLSRLVYWDPVCDGAEFYAAMARLHRRYVRGMQYLRLGRAPRSRRGVEELMGATYSDVAISEMKAMAMRPIARHAGRRAVPLTWLATAEPVAQQQRFEALAGSEAGSRFRILDVDCRWSEAVINDILPDVGIAGALTALVITP